MKQTEFFYYKAVEENKERRRAKRQVDILEKTKKTKYSVHHILPQSRGGSDEDNNLVVLDDEIHKRIHSLFENQTPAEQIISVLTWNSRAIKKEVRTAILQILIEHGDEIYNYKVKKGG